MSCVDATDLAAQTKKRMTNREKKKNEYPWHEAMVIAEQMTGAKFEVLRGEAGGVAPGLVAVECVGVGIEPQ